MVHVGAEQGGWPLPAKSMRRFALVGAVGVGMATAYLFRDALDMVALRHGLEHLGGLAPLAFIAAYALGAVVFAPAWIFTVSAGALFGPLWGTLYSMAGATIGATLAFLIARYLAADWVAVRVRGRLRRLIVGVEQEGWRFVAFARLMPLFPFNLLNYALGLTRIPLLQYVLASLVCMAPGALAYSWVGYAGAEALTDGPQAVQLALIALGLLAAVVFLPRLIRRYRARAACGGGDAGTGER